MTKDVQIVIEGRDMGPTGECITSKAIGTYHYQNGKHIIQYEEVAEEDGAVIRNLLKLSSEELTIKKEGAYHSHMVFNRSEVAPAQYGTPYGIMSFDIHTKELAVIETEKELMVSVQYFLSSQDNILSQNQVILRITPAVK